MRQRDTELNSYWGTICTPLELVAPDGKVRETNCANTEGVFRIIQSIPSPKAEPFKRWLAKVGYERVQEIEDPELGTKRTRALYKAKGYSDDWIEKRMRGIAIREEPTDSFIRQNSHLMMKCDSRLSAKCMKCALRRSRLSDGVLSNYEASRRR
jgi:hypothetical protein